MALHNTVRRDINLPIVAPPLMPRPPADDPRDRWENEPVKVWSGSPGLSICRPAAESPSPASSFRWQIHEGAARTRPCGDPVAQERGHIVCIALDKTDTLAGVGPGFRPPAGWRQGQAETDAARAGRALRHGHGEGSGAAFGIDDRPARPRGDLIDKPRPPELHPCQQDEGANAETAHGGMARGRGGGWRRHAAALSSARDCFRIDQADCRKTTARIPSAGDEIGLTGGGEPDGQTRRGHHQALGQIVARPKPDRADVGVALAVADQQECGQRVGEEAQDAKAGDDEPFGRRSG